MHNTYMDKDPTLVSFAVYATYPKFYKKLYLVGEIRRLKDIGYTYGEIANLFANAGYESVNGKMFTGKLISDMMRKNRG